MPYVPAKPPDSVHSPLDGQDCPARRQQRQCLHADAPYAGDILHLNYEFANSTVNLVDPSGYCVGCESNFRVNPIDAGPPNQRDDVLLDFKNRHWNFSGDIWDVLGREIDFVRWLQSSGRLTQSRRGNWYDVSDAYLAASRFAGERLASYIKSNYQCGNPQLGRLEPGVAEWAAFILVAENVPGVVLELQHFLILDEAFVAGGSTGMNIGFWRAHNTALREGVRRADAAGLRSQEPAEERTLINYILYNVLEPGDQCAAGNMAFCAFTFPFELNIGAYNIYPQHYPANQQDLDAIGDAFAEIYGLWLLLGARYPDPRIHLTW